MCQKMKGTETGCSDAAVARCGGERKSASSLESDLPEFNNAKHPLFGGGKQREIIESARFNGLSLGNSICSSGS